MLIRDFQPADGHSFRELVLGALLVDFKYPHHITQEDLIDPQEYYAKNGGKIFILENPDNQVIGSIAVSKTDLSTARICRFYIDRDYRSFGLGKMLLEQAIDYCQKQDCKRIYVDVWHKMEHAIKIYEKFGFLFEREENGELHMHLDLC
jgi:ribosomal protein S18 acetylase RimI-like enzyme